MIEVGEGAAGRQHDPAAQRFGHTSGPLPDPLDDVGLLELRLGGVDDQRLAAGELMVEEPSVPEVPPLGESGCQVCGGALSGIEVDVEVLAAEDPPVEVLVLDLVAAEVLGRQGRRGRGCRKHAREERRWQPGR
jgi:hypothetical protein